MTKASESLRTLQYYKSNQISVERSNSNNYKMNLYRYNKKKRN